ncbi:MULTISPECIES: F0F1 ATP synthase subunit B [Duncaniella]|jgi:F-type H+-transporting ATPase subunit b|uniref:ATP synthase subunit b n=6 Tax=Duncaniella TaxID=2518495 RepID=A0A4P7W1B7_9BACT|nr:MULTISPECIES: F0F1 ATP synthase subunit B [Duncaniella]MBJ2191163.1 F0F1 ATP synthase subunit B [Muribaculaceae bacterium]MCX4283373.1 F0F1 ATP synthase subunit B [Duncaniella dubosii]QCD41681.1 ATP synthase F0 subunit B [Duncaniella dubosii]ROS89279.1 ATP synthase F0 subunit B [Muribaculaceae bacterium Isolate-080 (Janvier)]
MELFTPDFGLVFWMFVSFAVLFFILWKWGWPVIMKGVSDRADLIDKGVEYAQNAKQQLDHAREEADKYIADARRQQADMLREADKMKSQIIEEARTAAQSEAKKVMDAAKVSIEQERKQAEQQFRNEVSSFALDIAQKVVRNEMKDEKAQEKLVNSLLDEMEKQN